MNRSHTYSSFDTATYPVSAGRYDPSKPDYFLRNLRLEREAQARFESRVMTYCLVAGVVFALVLFDPHLAHHLLSVGQRYLHRFLSHTKF